MILARIENAVDIGDERTDQGCQVEEAVPVGVVTRQATGLVGQDQADTTERDLGDQELEAGASAVAAGLPQIVIDDLHQRPRPAKPDPAVDERVLVSLTGTMLPNLPWGGLANVDQRLPLLMTRRDLVSEHHGHEPPPATARPASGGTVSAPAGRGRPRPTGVAAGLGRSPTSVWTKRPTAAGAESVVGRSVTSASS